MPMTKAPRHIPTCNFLAACPLCYNGRAEPKPRLGPGVPGLHTSKFPCRRRLCGRYLFPYVNRRSCR